MPVTTLQFEMERRSVIFHRDTTMGSGDPLGYIGDPNYANPDNSSGELLIHWCPAGSFYIDKGTTPQTFWVKLIDGPGGQWVRSDGTGEGGGSGGGDSTTWSVVQW